MNSTLILGTIIVTLALVLYTIGVFLEQRSRFVSPKVLFFLTIGIISDVTATIFMIIGSNNGPITFHGCLGYSALAAMLIDIVLIWRHWFHRHGNQTSTPLHFYTRIAYIWWILAFIAGGFLTMKP